MSAIATANPAADEYYTEPLDPANLDRFTLQIRSVGLIEHGNWDDAASVIAMAAAGENGGRCLNADAERRDPTLLVNAYEQLLQVEVTKEVKMYLLTLLKTLRTKYGLTPDNSLLTDRTFLVKAVKVLKAAAMVAGRSWTEPVDMHALCFITTFRVPSSVHNEVPETIARIISGEISTLELSDKSTIKSTKEPSPSLPASVSPTSLPSQHENRVNAWEEPDEMPTWRKGNPGEGPEHVSDFSSFFHTQKSRGHKIGGPKVKPEAVVNPGEPKPFKKTKE